MKYGSAPRVLGAIPLSVNEVMYYLYYPVSLAGQQGIHIEPRLEPFLPLLRAVQVDEPKRFVDENVYLTVKKSFVGGGVTPNRPGWHTDGFGSDDLNYVWHDSVPTVFNVGEFNITEDHAKSLEEFAEQSKPENDRTYPNGHLIRLDSSIVHRVGDVEEQVMRVFAKVSISKRRFNLTDNSKNHGLTYNWKMFDRHAVRNDPSTAQSDSADSSTAPDDHFV